MNTLPSYRNQQRGFTLTELMVSLTLGLFLIAGVVQLFVGSKSTNNTLNAVSDIQQSGRIAIERLKTSLRMAGHIGCSNLGVTEPEIIATALPFAFDLDSVVVGANNSPSSVAGTDVLTVITSTGAAADLKLAMTAEDSDVTLTHNPDNIDVGDALVIADCVNSDVFIASSVTNNTSDTVIKHKAVDDNGDPANVNSELSQKYSANALVLRLSEITYDIRDTGRADKNGNPILSLFETRGGTSTEVVSGVEDMTLTYGVPAGLSESVNEYKTATQLAADGDSWGSVISVRIVLLVSTEGDSGNDTHRYRLNGSVVTPTTGVNRIRKVFTTTVNLRNRVS